MSRRVVGIAIALLLALMGTIALVAYVSSAEDRALAGQDLVEVYVVASPVPAGTLGDDIEQFVRIEQVPVKVQATRAVENLGELAGHVASVDLLPGEQLVRSRFIEPSEFTDRGAGVQIPEDMIEITVELEAQRAVGGLLEPGQTVAVFGSFDPFEISGSSVIEVDGEEVALPGEAAEEAGAQFVNTTDLLLRKVLVTAVQEEASNTLGGTEESDRLETAPDSSVFVTLAVRPFDGERLVFTAEFGFIWLAIERDAVPEVDDPPQTRGSVYEDQDLTR